MGMFGGSPKPPKPLPVVQAPTEQDIDLGKRKRAAEDEMRLNRRKGAASTILTGEGGLKSLGGVASRNLLG